MIPLSDGDPHDSQRLPIAYAEDTQLLALYTTRNAWPDGKKFGDAWVLETNRRILRITAAPSRAGVWVPFDDHTTTAVSFANEISIASG